MSLEVELGLLFGTLTTPLYNQSPCLLNQTFGSLKISTTPNTVVSHGFQGTQK